MYRFLKSLTDPYTVALLMFGALLLVRRFRSGEPNRRLRWLTIVWAILYLLSLPFVSSLMHATLASGYDDTIPEHADVIIVLGGGVSRAVNADDPTYLSNHSYQRCLQAIRVFERSTKNSRILLCGGRDESSQGETEASAMARFLEQMGVPAGRLTMEDESRSTFENAVNAARRLKTLGNRQVVLVTHYQHLPRSVAAFRKQGIEVTPCGAGAQECSPPARWYDNLLPKADALATSRSVVHEWLGLLWYKIRGRI